MDGSFTLFCALLILLIARFAKTPTSKNFHPLLFWICELRKGYSSKHPLIFKGEVDADGSVRYVAKLCKQALFAGGCYLPALRTLENLLRQEQRYAEARQSFLRILAFRLAALMLLASLGRFYVAFVKGSVYASVDKLLLGLALLSVYFILAGLAKLYPASWFYGTSITGEGQQWLGQLFAGETAWQRSGLDLTAEQKMGQGNFLEERKFMQDNFVRQFLEYVPAIELVFFMVPPFLVLACPVAYFLS